MFLNTTAYPVAVEKVFVNEKLQKLQNMHLFTFFSFKTEFRFVYSNNVLRGHFVSVMLCGKQSV